MLIRIFRAKPTFNDFTKTFSGEGENRRGKRTTNKCDIDRVREIKGDSRPVNSEEDRRRILETSRFVDEVVIFNSKEALQNLYKSLRPNLIIKGSEWTADEVRERDNIPDEVLVKVFPILPDYSTTNTLKKIRKLDTEEKF